MKFPQDYAFFIEVTNLCPELEKVKTFRVANLPDYRMKA